MAAKCSFNLALTDQDNYINLRTTFLCIISFEWLFAFKERSQKHQIYTRPPKQKELLLPRVFTTQHASLTLSRTSFRLTVLLSEEPPVVTEAVMSQTGIVIWWYLWDINTFLLTVWKFFPPMIQTHIYYSIWSWNNAFYI